MLLKLISEIPKTHYKALFECYCGKRFVTYRYNVFSGHTRSCGCYKASDVSKSRTYKAWLNMKSRCLNANTPYYHIYGGRGIRIYHKWIYSFAAFVKDMGECPPGLSLDRIDVNGNYGPENCRWANGEVQGNNKRTNVFLTKDKRTKTITQWARDLGLKPNTLQYRLYRGWTLEMALTERKQ